jgi:lysophospholipase L1-like esterase
MTMVARPRILLVMGALLSMAGCASDPDGQSAGGPASNEPPNATDGGAFLDGATDPSALPSSPLSYRNPVVAGGCADPNVVVSTASDGSRYQLVCGAGRFAIWSSPDLVTWKKTGATVLGADKPSWASSGDGNRAPAIHRVGDGFVAYFTSLDSAGMPSIGAASSRDVLGPYTDLGHALLTHPDGAVDPHLFEDAPGSRWLVYSIEGQVHGKPSQIFARQLTADGLAFSGDAKLLLTNDAATWEKGIVGAPRITSRGGKYYLFYGGGADRDHAQIGVARATNLLGPYEKRGGPIVVDNDAWLSPGRGSIARVGDADALVYQASRSASGAPDTAAGPQVLVDAIAWTADGWPKINDGTPSATPRLTPGHAPAPEPAYDPCPASLPCWVMPLGDSITAGIGSSTGLGYRPPLRQLVAKDALWMDFVGTQSAPDGHHEGHPGWAMPELRASIDEFLSKSVDGPGKPARPHVVLLMIGTNDTINRDPAGLPRAPSRLDDLVYRITTDAPGTLVVVAQIVPTRTAAVDSGKVVPFNAEVPALVERRAAIGEHVVYVDMHAALDVATDFNDDVHPNDSGYRKMAAVWYAALRPLLKHQ